MSRMVSGVAALAALVMAAVVMAAAPTAGTAGAAARRPQARIVAVGAENQYANVIGQVGGRFVRVSAVMSNPATDPHQFEASTQVAEEVASARLVVQNGLGYDAFMGRLEAASPNSSRRVIDVQTLLHLPSSTPNPHLWYKPSTMPAVAAAIARDLSAMDPAHRGAFQRNLAAFDRSLQPWRRAIAALKARFGGARVATTEPVADYLLQAAGLDNATPFSFQADIMNGVDPSPQDVSVEQSLLRGKVKVFVYNRQVTDSLTSSLLSIARAAHVPVVGVYETMPAPGFDYQSWMTAEVSALTRALARRVSAPSL